jgi:hypothetical protein
MQQPTEKTLRRIALGLLAVLAIMAIVLLFISDNLVFPIVVLIAAALGALRVWSEIRSEHSR